MKEFHYITHIANVRRIVERGVVSHNAADGLQHVSVADPDVQDLRSIKLVMGRPLHDYANLYFDARNPMMTRMRSFYDEIAVVRVDAAALDLPGSMIADGNAAAGATQFFLSPDGLSELEAERVYAAYWVNAFGVSLPGPRRQRCAELLVPDRVPPDLIAGVYVRAPSSRLLRDPGVGAPVEVNGHLYL